MAKTKRRPGTEGGSAQTQEISNGSRPPTVTTNNIACRAYELYEERGCEHGRDMDDWLLAEHELHDAVRVTIS